MSDKEENKGTKEQHELRDKIKDIRVAMFTTAEKDGTLRSRPMATQEMDPDGVLWFFSYRDSGKVQEIENDANVNLCYSAPDKDLFVSVSGKASLVDDKAKAKELWNPFAKAWFQKGLDDPNLGLLKVKVEQAEYWDAPSGKMVQLVGMVKMLVTGKPTEMGEDKKVSF